MMRPLTFLAPIAWSFAAGHTLEPLARALGTPRADLVASALQTVSFFGLCTAVLWVEAVRARAQAGADLTRRDWSEKRRELIAEEKETARQYQAVMDLRFKLVIQNQHYTFPSVITPDHLLHLAKVVGDGKKPTDRALVPPFERGAGKSYQIIKDYMIYNPNHAPGELAVELSGRGDWSLTRAGMGKLLQWISYPAPLLARGQATKTACLRLAKQMRAIEQSIGDAHAGPEGE